MGPSCDFPALSIGPNPPGRLRSANGHLAPISHDYPAATADPLLFASQSGGLNVAAKAENMILKLMLMRSRALLLGSTEWGTRTTT